MTMSTRPEKQKPRAIEQQCLPASGRSIGLLLRCPSRRLPLVCCWLDAIQDDPSKPRCERTPQNSPECANQPEAYRKPMTATDCPCFFKREFVVRIRRSDHPEQSLHGLFAAAPSPTRTVRRLSVTRQQQSPSPLAAARRIREPSEPARRSKPMHRPATP